jgi:hypothetical protein
MALLVIAAGPVLSTASAGDGGALSRSDTYEGGQYTIEVPARWNEGLVLYAHGFRGTQASPLASHLFDQGYAGLKMTPMRLICCPSCLNSRIDCSTGTFMLAPGTFLVPAPLPVVYAMVLRSLSI